MRAYLKDTHAFRGSEFQAVVQQGCQYFTIGTGDKDHCDFLVRMFTVALEHHDAAVAQTAERLPCKQDVGCATHPSGSTSWGQSATALYPSKP